MTALGKGVIYCWHLVFRTLTMYFNPEQDAEVKNKEDQMEAMEKDYKDLMDIKVALDVEISAYRKLLEGL